MRAFLLAALLPAALSAQVSTDSARSITLNEAIELARQNSPQVISARNAINANEASVRTRMAAFLPTVSGSFSSGWSGGQTFNSAGDIISRKCHVPHLYRLEVFGTPEDVERVSEGLERWQKSQ